MLPHQHVPVHPADSIDRSCRRYLVHHSKLSYCASRLLKLLGSDHKHDKQQTGRNSIQSSARSQVLLQALWTDREEQFVLFFFLLIFYLVHRYS